MVKIPFTWKRKLENREPLSINGVKILFNSKGKNLGIILHKKLNWNSHLEKTVHKAALLLWTCRNIYWQDIFKEHIQICLVVEKRSTEVVPSIINRYTKTCLFSNSGVLRTTLTSRCWDYHFISM